MTDLPAEAIDAACQALQQHWPNDHEGFIHDDAVTVLEAAAPAIRQQATTAERWRIARLIRAEAGSGQKLGLTRIQLRAFADFLEQLGDKSHPAEPIGADAQPGEPGSGRGTP